MLTFTALRSVDQIFVEYSTGERELYDLVEDPYQLNNQAAEADPALMADTVHAGGGDGQVRRRRVPRRRGHARMIRYVDSLDDIAAGSRSRASSSAGSTPSRRRRICGC